MTTAASSTGITTVTSEPGRSFPLDVPLAQLRRRRSAKWTTFDADVLPLPVAEMDVRLAPPIAAALAAALQDSDTGYAGDPARLFETYAAFAVRRWGWQVSPQRMAMSADVAQGVVEVMRATLAPGDGVIICPPVYPPFFEWLTDVGVRVVEVPLLGPDQDWRLDLGGIETALRAGARAVLLCHPHNPTGRIHEPHELRRLADMAADAGAIVLSDEIHSPLTMPGSSFTPYLTVSDTARATGFAFVSASKAWNLAGLKCAQIIAGGDEHTAVLRRLPTELRYGAGHLGLLAAEAAYAQGEAWLAQLAGALQRNLDLLGSLLVEALPQVRWMRPEVGFLAWLDMRNLGLGADPSVAILQHGRVALVPGPSFGRAGAGFARLNVGCSPELLRAAVARIAAAVPGVAAG